jgi:hypothetical protein
MPEPARQSVLFRDIFSKPVVATFSAERTSSDGGSVLLIPIDREMELTARVAATIVDRRQAGKVTQEILAIVRQRVFGIAAGYPDGNDAARLASDPMLLLACERAPLSGAALASQPTLSRFENALRPRTLLRMAEALARAVLEHQKRRCWNIKSVGVGSVDRGGSPSTLIRPVTRPTDSKSSVCSMDSTQRVVTCRWW